MGPKTLPTVPSGAFLKNTLSPISGSSSQRTMYLPSQVISSTIPSVLMSRTFSGLVKNELTGCNPNQYLKFWTFFIYFDLNWFKAS